MFLGSSGLFHRVLWERETGRAGWRGGAAWWLLRWRARSRWWGATARFYLWLLWSERPDDKVWPVLSRFGTRVRYADTIGLPLIALGHPDALEPKHRRELLECARRDDGHPVAEAARSLIRDAPAAFRDALCEEALGEADVAEACVAAGAFPSDPARRAVFALLTGQFEQYEAGDPDGTLLVAGYTAADGAGRRRVREALVEGGRGDLLRLLASGAPLPVPTAAGIRHLAVQLGASRDVAGLVALARRLPLAEAVDAVHQGPAGPNGDPLYGLLRGADLRAVRRARRRMDGAGREVELSGVPLTASVAPNGVGVAVLTAPPDRPGRGPCPVTLTHVPLSGGEPASVTLDSFQLNAGTRVHHSGRRIALGADQHIKLFSLSCRRVGRLTVPQKRADTGSVYAMGDSEVVDEIWPVTVLPGADAPLLLLRAVSRRLNSRHVARDELAFYDRRWNETARREIAADSWYGRTYEGSDPTTPLPARTVAVNADGSTLAYQSVSKLGLVRFHDVVGGRTAVKEGTRGVQALCFRDAGTVAGLYAGGALRVDTDPWTDSAVHARRDLAGVHEDSHLVHWGGLLLANLAPDGIRGAHTLGAYDAVTLEDAEPPALPEDTTRLSGLWTDPAGTWLAVAGPGRLRIQLPHDRAGELPAAVPLDELAPRHLRVIEAARSAAADPDVAAFLQLLRDCVLLRTGDAVALGAGTAVAGPHDVAVRPVPYDVASGSVLYDVASGSVPYDMASDSVPYDSDARPVPYEEPPA
ncbi:hypothetical protein AB0M28_04725 [Streptomyces sp. NPDC051940]|uniref:hypothetical protein n=1 Tax=Streptomyces sp. NPDC051940 TaxID=3155675 RepID=UPI0034276AD3